MTQSLNNSHKVDIWRFSLEANDNLIEYYSQFLNQCEINQATSYANSQRRAQWIISRAVLKLLIESKTNIQANAISLLTRDSGKPCLDSNENIRCEFNLSHSQNTAVIAISMHHPIGIDIQFWRPSIKPEEFSKRFFSTEEHQVICSLSSQAKIDAFYQLWTRKEALFKAIGDGINLNNLKFNLIHPTLVLNNDNIVLNKSNYCVNSLPKLDHCSWAVAIKSDRMLINLQEWKHPIA